MQVGGEVVAIYIFLESPGWIWKASHYAFIFEQVSSVYLNCKRIL